MRRKAPPASRQPGQLTLRLADAAAAPLPENARSIVFQHTVLCQTVMPYRDPGCQTRAWSRSQGGICLEIEAGKAFDRRAGGFVELGLPYGPKPRLIFYYLNTEALRTKSPEIEVSSSLTAFTKRIGLSGSGRDLRVMKEQLARFAAARFYLGIANADGTDTTIKGDIIEGFDLWFPKDERQRVLWPETVRFSERYFESLLAHAIPLNERAIALLSHTALGLDIYAWLAQRLHRVPFKRPQFIPWSALKEQFGQGFGRMDNFKAIFRETLRTVYCVYPEARFELDDRGMMLTHSSPPVPCRLLALKT
jgi:hypothetical protein